jgi:hypothetical protein
MGDRRAAYRLLVGILERERQTTWKIRRRWEDNIKTDLKELEWGDMNWIDLAPDKDRLRALVNAVMNFRVA